MDYTRWKLSEVNKGAAHQDHGNVREPIVGLADVIQSGVIEQNFLKNECRYRFRQLGSRFHYS